MKFVLTRHSITGHAAFPYTIKVAAIVPAARFLAKISPDRSLVSKLRARHLTGCHSEAREKTGNKGTGRELGDRRKTAYGHTLRCLIDSRKPFDTTNTHDSFNRKDPLPHASEKVCPARMNQSVVSGEVLYCLIDRVCPDILKRRHHERTPLRFPKAVRSPGGDIGVSVIRTPVAL